MLDHTQGRDVMKAYTLLVTLAVVLAVVAVPLTALAQPSGAFGGSQTVSDTPMADENETDETPPGARLAGSIGAQQAEIGGEIDSRAFQNALDRAPSDTARARVVADRTDDITERLSQLEERREKLRQARRNGSISNGTYAAELTELAARSEATRELANRSRSAAAALPREIAREQGVNVTAISLLERRAANLTGPEVARIARSIAGPGVGRPLGVGPPSDVGPPGNLSVGPPVGDRADPPLKRSTGAVNGSDSGPTASVPAAGPPDGGEGDNTTDGDAARNVSETADDGSTVVERVAGAAGAVAEAVGRELP